MARSTGRRQVGEGGHALWCVAQAGIIAKEGGRALWHVAPAGIPLGNNAGEGGRALWRMARAGILS